MELFTETQGGLYIGEGLILSPIRLHKRLSLISNSKYDYEIPVSSCGLINSLLLNS